MLKPIAFDVTDNWADMPGGPTAREITEAPVGVQLKVTDIPGTRGQNLQYKKVSPDGWRHGILGDVESNSKTAAYLGSFGAAKYQYKYPHSSPGGLKDVPEELVTQTGKDRHGGMRDFYGPDFIKGVTEALTQYTLECGMEVTWTVPSLEFGRGAEHYMGDTIKFEAKGYLREARPVADTKETKFGVMRTQIRELKNNIELGEENNRIKDVAIKSLTIKLENAFPESIKWKTRQQYGFPRKDMLEDFLSWFEGEQTKENRPVVIKQIRRCVENYLTGKKDSE